MTFLEIVQKVAQESGTVGNLSEPSTVTGQSGRLLRIVNWTQDAYTDIQTMHPHWLWMRGTFSGSLLTGTREYSGTDLTATRFARFAFRDNKSTRVSVYDPAVGQDDEGFLEYRQYEAFYEACLVGAAATQTGKPQLMTVTPEGKIAVYPLPDKTYTVRGMYHKSPEELTADADIPAMPVEYHRAIVWGALVLLGTYDEAAPQLPIWRSQRDALISRMEAAWLPPMQTAGALA